MGELCGGSAVGVMNCSGRARRVRALRALLPGLGVKLLPAATGRWVLAAAARRDGRAPVARESSLMGRLTAEALTEAGGAVSSLPASPCPGEGREFQPRAVAGSGRRLLCARILWKRKAEAGSHTAVTKLQWDRLSVADNELVTVAWAAPVSLQAFTGDLEAVLSACTGLCGR